MYFNIIFVSLIIETMLNKTIRIMRTQKFFNVTLEFQNQKHLLGRNVVESWLQFFFSTTLKGRDLAEFIGVKKIKIITIKEEHDNPNWWESCFAVTKIS